MIIIDQKLSNKLANFSFVCALLIVFIHCQSGGTDASSHFLRTYVPGAFLAMAVPSFFAISGFLLAGKFGEFDWYRSALRKRIKTLFIPFVILNFSYWPLKFAIHTIAMRNYGSIANTMSLCWSTPFDILGVPYFNGPAIGPLWYISSLMYFVIISPLFCKIISKSKLSSWILVLSSILVFWISRCGMFEISKKLGEFLYFGFSLWGLIFFSLGMTVRTWFMKIPDGITAVVCGLTGVICALFLARHKLCGDNILYIIPTIMCMIGLFFIIPGKRWPSCVVNNSFVLYALHVPFIYFFSALLKLIHGYELTFTWWGLIGEYIICVISVIVCINKLRRFCSKLVVICFGGR